MIRVAAQMAAAAEEPSPIRDVVNTRALRSPLFIIMKIIPVANGQLPFIIELLKSNNLPVQDISETVHLFMIGNANKVEGVAGIEYDKEFGLLRSLAVKQDSRGTGLGKSLVAFVELFAKEHEVRELYLLTNTAERYFSRLNYTIIERNEAPDFIRGTSEFKSVCPASAVIMKKEL